MCGLFIKTSVLRLIVRYALYCREVLITVSVHTDKFDYELLKNVASCLLLCVAVCSKQDAYLTLPNFKVNLYFKLIFQTI